MRNKMLCSILLLSTMSLNVLAESKTEIDQNESNETQIIEESNKCNIEKSHVHDDKCGFKDAKNTIEGSPCQHIHDENCDGLESDSSCTHLHDENCGYVVEVPAVEASPCTYVHIHDENCQKLEIKNEMKPIVVSGNDTTVNSTYELNLLNNPVNKLSFSIGVGGDYEDIYSLISDDKVDLTNKDIILNMISDINELKIATSSAGLQTLRFPKGINSLTIQSDSTTENRKILQPGLAIDLNGTPTTFIRIGEPKVMDINGSYMNLNGRIVGVDIGNLDSFPLPSNINIDLVDTYIGYLSPVAEIDFFQTKKNDIKFDSVNVNITNSQINSYQTISSGMYDRNFNLGNVNIDILNSTAYTFSGLGNIRSKTTLTANDVVINFEKSKARMFQSGEENMGSSSNEPFVTNVKSMLANIKGSTIRQFMGGSGPDNNLTSYYGSIITNVNSSFISQMYAAGLYYFSDWTNKSNLIIDHLETNIGENSLIGGIVQGPYFYQDTEGGNAPITENFSFKITKANNLNIKDSKVTNSIYCGVKDTLFAAGTVDIDMADINVQLDNVEVEKGWIYFANANTKSNSSINSTDLYNINIQAFNLKANTIVVGRYNQFLGDFNASFLGNTKFANFVGGSWFENSFEVQSKKITKLVFDDKKTINWLYGTTDIETSNPIIVNDLDPIAATTKIKIINVDSWGDGQLVLGVPVNKPNGDKNLIEYLEKDNFVSAQPERYELEFKNNSDFIGWFLKKKDIVNNVPTPTPPINNEIQTFTKDECGNIFDKWGNIIYEQKGCQVDKKYKVPNTSVK